MIQNKHSVGIVAVLALLTILCAGCLATSNLAGTYEVEENPDLVLELFNDRTFYCKGSWCELSGDYSVQNDTVYFQTYFGTFTAKINGTTLIESDDMVWVKQ